MKEKKRKKNNCSVLKCTNIKEKKKYKIESI